MSRHVTSEMQIIYDRGADQGGYSVEVPDLTHPGTVKLIWRWLETDVGLKGSHLDALRSVHDSYPSLSYHPY